MAQTLLTSNSAPASNHEAADLSAQVVAALRRAVPPETVRQRFGLSREQFQSIVGEMNRAAVAWLDAWQAEDVGEPDAGSPAIDKLLRDNPLLQEVSFK